MEEKISNVQEADIMQAKLTQTFVNSVKPADKLLRIRDTATVGLVLFVNAGGKKTYFIDYKKPNGKRADNKIGDATRYTLAEAREEAQKFLSSVEKGVDPSEPEKKKITLGEFVKNSYEPWVLDYRRSGESTLYMLKSNFGFLFDTPLDEITIAQVEQWRGKRKRDGLKTVSINRRITALKAAINWAAKRGIIETSPLTKLERLSEEDSDTIVRYLNEEERERLMAALDAREEEMRRARASHGEFNETREYEPIRQFEEGEFTDHLKPLVLLSLSTGIRRNSILSLEWRDVSFADRTILVRAATSKSGKQYYSPMNKLAFDTLTRWHGQSRHTAPSNLVFPSPQTGKKMGDCRTSWETIVKKAGLEDFHWHDMRHDFASHLVMNGVDLNTVRELMGHADLKMTLRYAHLAPETKMRAVETLDR
jgi:site-specific recombinase XerD